MITVPLSRQFAEDLQTHLFPYLKLLKQTKLNNVARCVTQSDEYLTVLLMNCITDELMLAINKKLINSSSKKINLKMSDAVVVIFYKILLAWPIDKNQFYLNNMRNFLVEAIDKILKNHKIYQYGTAAKKEEREPQWWEYEE